MLIRSCLAPGLLIAATSMLIASATAQESTEAPGAEVAEHMHEHLSAISAMKTFIIAGQLDGMREPAVWMEEHVATPGLPGDWEPYVTQMRRYAGEAASARHLVFAAASVSEMARVCGDCHEANGAEVGLGNIGSPPADNQDVRTQMRRHLWAVNRMWQGLIGPSDSAWTGGSEVLAMVRVKASDIARAPNEEPQVNYLIKRLREIGAAGSEATSRESRSVLYGELLSLCADCHTWTGGGPGN